MKKDPELEKVVSKLFEENVEYLQKIGINTKDEALKKCMRLPDYLAKRKSKEYGAENKNYLKYQEDPNLREVIAFIGERDGEKMASFIGTENSTLHGHIADEIVSGKNNGKIKLDPQIQKLLYKKINLEFKDSLTQEEKENIISGENMLVDDVELMAKEGGLDNVRDKVIKEKNTENGTSKYQEEKEKKLHLTEAQKSMCKRLGVTEEKVKDVITVRATDLIRKTDGYSMAENQVNGNHGYVTILQVGTEKATGPDRYYGLQDGKMVLYGFNETNEDLGRIFDETGSTKYDGRLVTPLRAKDGTEEVSITGANGKKVELNVNDNSELCTHDVNNYRDEMQKLLVDYSTEMTEAKENGASFEEMKKIGEKYKDKSEEIAERYDIDFETNENAFDIVEDEALEDSEVDENNNGELDEEDLGYDEHGPIVPGRRTH